MSINLFFILLLGLLVGMYNYFTPNYTLSKEVGEIPKIELFAFTLYEISHKGIEHILEGQEGKKFDERYTVTSAKFSDNTKTLFQTIRSDNVDYQSDVINLMEMSITFVKTDWNFDRMRGHITQTLADSNAGRFCDYPKIQSDRW